MKAIINGFDHKDQISIIKNLTNDFNIKSLTCIIGSRDEFDSISKITKDVFVVPEIIFGNYYCPEPILPLDSVIVEKMIQFEPAIMRQMDRFEVYIKRSFSYDERKEIYYKHLRFWNHIIRTKSIDFYIGGNIPHDIYDFVIYALCKVYGIKTLYFYQSQIKDIIHPMSDWNTFTPETPIKYSELSNTYKDATIESISLSKDMQLEWEQFHQDQVPFYMHNKRLNIFSLLAKYFKLFLRFLKGLNNLNGLYRRIQNKKLDKSYNRLVSTPDLNRNYIYFPLHYQPELTSCPLGGIYADQILIIQLLDFILPEGVSLLVKEHPKQEFASRHYNYYKNLLENTSKVFLMPKSTSSFELIKGSKAVVTISGTAGWESLFRNKPVLLFGHNFYQYAPGVFCINTIDECKAAIKNITDKDLVIDSKQLKVFLKAVDETSIKGYIDIAYSGISNYSCSESAYNIYKYIKEYLNQ